MRRFGDVLKQYREERGLTLRELAKLTDLDHAYIHRLEKGEKSSPSRDVINALVRALKLTPRKRQLLDAMLSTEAGVPDDLWDAMGTDNEITIDAFTTAAKVSYRGKRPSSKEEWLTLMRDLDRDYFRRNDE